MQQLPTPERTRRTLNSPSSFSRPCTVSLLEARRRHEPRPRLGADLLAALGVPKRFVAPYKKWDFSNSKDIRLIASTQGESGFLRRYTSEPLLLTLFRACRHLARMERDQEGRWTAWTRCASALDGFLGRWQVGD